MPLRCAGIFGFCKGIAIFHPERILYIFFAIYLTCASFKVIECADVIQSSCVVLMIVGEQDGIKVGHSLAEHLLSEIRTCIHENAQSLVIHENACAKPLVARVLAAAYITSASYHRHSL